MSLVDLRIVENLEEMESSDPEVERILENVPNMWVGEKVLLCMERKVY